MKKIGLIFVYILPIAIGIFGLWVAIPSLLDHSYAKTLQAVGSSDNTTSLWVLCGLSLFLIVLGIVGLVTQPRKHSEAKKQKVHKENTHIATEP